jgi:hypothetical protein
MNSKMETFPLTSKAYFKAIQIVYYALIAGQLFFAFIILFLIYGSEFKPEMQDFKNVFIIVVTLFAIGGLFASQIIFRNRLDQAKSRTNLPEKLADYRSALIVRFALLEFPSFGSIVFCMITGEVIFLGMSGLIVAVFLAIKPTKDKAIMELELNSSDVNYLNNPDNIVG